MKAEERLSFFSAVFMVTIALYFIYNVEYRFSPMGIPTSYWMILLFSFLGFIILSLKNYLLKVQTKPLFFSMLFMLTALLSYAINAGEADIFMVRMSLVFFLILLFVPMLVNTFFRRRPSRILFVLGCVGLINAIMIVTMLVIPDFRTAYSKLISASVYGFLGANVFESLMTLRMVGVTGLSVYSAGFTQTVLAILYLLYVRMHFNKPRTRDIFIFTLILGSAFLVSRSSIIGIFFFLVCYARFFGSRSFFKLILLFVFCGTILGFIVSIAIGDQADFLFSWAFEIFLKGVNTGSLQSNISMFKYGPEDFSLIGDSRWFGAGNGYYMGSDVGWYRLLFDVGYLGAFCWLLLIFSCVGKRNFFLFWKNDISFVSMNLLLFVLIMMFKGAILFDSFQSILYFVILAWLAETQAGLGFQGNK